MIVAQTKQQGWDFIFAGANIDAFAAGNNYGILQDNCAQISNNGKAQSAIYSAVAKRASLLPYIWSGIRFTGSVNGMMGATFQYS